jgi:hypothetical protein
LMKATVWAGAPEAYSKTDRHKAATLGRTR